MVVAIVVVILIGLVVLCLAWPEFDEWRLERKRQKSIRRDSIIQDIYIKNARYNYLAYRQAIELLEKILDADEDIPSLKSIHLAEAKTLINEFNRQLTEGQ